VVSIFGLNSLSGAVFRRIFTQFSSASFCYLLV